MSPDSKGSKQRGLWVALVLASCSDGNLNPVLADLRFSPAEIIFGNVQVGEIENVQLQLFAVGTPELNIEEMSIRADDASSLLLQNPPQRISDSGTTVTIGFAPSMPMLLQGALHIRATGTREALYVVPIAGRGTNGELELVYDDRSCDGAGIDFGLHKVGQTTERTFSVRALSAEVTVNRVAMLIGSSLAFSLALVDRPPLTLAEGETMTIRAGYSPLDYGADRGTIVVETSNGQELRIPLCGQSSDAALCVTPSPLAFGEVAVGLQRTELLRLQSCGLEPLTITGVELTSEPEMPSSPDFGTGPLAPPVLLRNEDFRDLAVTVQPSTEGLTEGWLKIHSNATGAPETIVPLTAAGRPACSAELVPAQLRFPGVQLGERLVRRALLISHAGVHCPIDELAVTSGGSTFSLVDPPTALAPGDVLAVAVRYTPAAEGQIERGTLQLRMPGYPPQAIELIGNPPASGRCSLDIIPSVINAGVTQIGQNKAFSATLVNVSDTPCAVQSAALSPSSSPTLSTPGLSPFTLEAGAFTTIELSHRPVRSGLDRGMLILETNSGTQPALTADVFGHGADARLCVEPTLLEFSSAPSQMAVSLTACGDQEVTITSLDWTDADDEFSIASTHTLPLTLRPSEQTEILIAYQPNDTDSDWASLTVRSDDPLTPATLISLVGGDAVPPQLGRSIYFWQDVSQGNLAGGTIFKISLQTPGPPQTVHGAAAGDGCVGCHSISPDGRYVAFSRTLGPLQIMDTTTGLLIPTGITDMAEAISWNPDVNTSPSHQFVYSDSTHSLQKASVNGGPLGALVPSYARMPSWGPDGKIAYVRGADTEPFGYLGPTDIMLVPENGGLVEPLVGASLNGQANYYPRFSPDGRWLAYTNSASAIDTYAASDAKIMLVRADQSGQRVSLSALDDPLRAESYPTWSLDGRALSYSSNGLTNDDDWDIFIARIEPLTGQISFVAPLVGANSNRFEHGALWSPVP